MKTIWFGPVLAVALLTWAAPAQAQQIAIVAIDRVNNRLTATGSGLNGVATATLGAANLVIVSGSATQVVMTLPNPALAPSYYRLTLRSKGGTAIATFDVDLTLGPPGPQGPAGVQGPIGPMGATGAT